MTETKGFPIAVVLTVATGIMVTDDFAEVYEILSWMAQEPIYTHQIPRLSMEARPVLVDAFPSLAQAIADKGRITPDNFDMWVQEWAEVLGSHLAIPLLSEDQHERIDPISELAEKVHPDKILVVSCKE